MTRRSSVSATRGVEAVHSRLPAHASLLALGLLLAAPLLAPLAAQRYGPDTPVNDLPNPYRTVEGWAKLPTGRTWGSTSAVAIDQDGVSVWVAERCAQNSCVGSPLDPVLKFDSTGTLVKSFGAGMINWPHGIFVDHENNVWVVDGRDNMPPRARGDTTTPTPPANLFGHQVLKFSPDGELLMRLGASGGGRGAEYFWQPNAVYVMKDGTIFVAEGHSSSDDANARVLKFDRTGKLLTQWGSKGTGPGQFDQPHALAMDSRGRLFVADRGNDRLQLFDQNGKYLETWHQFSRISGLVITPGDTLYAADSESGSIEPSRTAWKRGIRIGSALDGTVWSFIPDPVETTRNTSAAEGVSVDARGNVYGAEVGPRALTKYIKR